MILAPFIHVGSYRYLHLGLPTALGLPKKFDPAPSGVRIDIDAG